MIENRGKLLDCLRRYREIQKILKYSNPTVKTEETEEYKKLVLKVSRISDLYQLVQILEDTPLKLQRPVIERIIDVLHKILPAIFDFNELIEMRRLAYFPLGWQPIERRIAEILPEILPEVDDLLELIEMREKIFNPSEGGRLIEKRMKELINQISASKVPEWFEPLLSNPDNVNRIPVDLRILLNQKIEEVWESLEPSS